MVTHRWRTKCFLTQVPPRGRREDSLLQCIIQRLSVSFKVAIELVHVLMEAIVGVKGSRRKETTQSRFSIILYFLAKSCQFMAVKIKSLKRRSQTLYPSIVHLTACHISNCARSLMLVIWITDFTGVGEIDLVGLRGSLKWIEHEYKNLLVLQTKVI